MARENPCDSTALDSKQWAIAAGTNGGWFKLYDEGSNGNDTASVSMYNQGGNGGRVEVRTDSTTTTNYFQGLLYGDGYGGAVWLGNESQN